MTDARLGSIGVRAVTISATGRSGKLSLSTISDPVPGIGEVLVNVAAAGVNHADLLQRAGHYPPPAGAPDWPGLEISGEITRVGTGVSGWQEGDRVVALLDGGGYADQVTVRATQVLPAPRSVDLVDAAALPEAVCTAWDNLVTVGGLRAGEWVLIHGGSGGVGTTAIQLSKALGARVAATAGGRERADRCSDLGVDLPIDYREQDFVALVRDASGGSGADVVLDVVGAAYLDDNVRALARGGRLVVIGLQRGRRGELDLGTLMAKRATVTGTTLRSRPPAEKAAVVAAVRDHVWPMVDDGQVRPVVHARLPLAEAQQAHELLESGEVFGKVLLVP
ncbi:NAD(P)H-quinone oxidoreductase [Myceligenerans indicum]|uniref:NAD(P)H-quinone oxidoreductase n=1 Tax=Myceligenerans indicum TaxID=2593663 RepID=A0ABS1LIL0_9MICO|nr:NAD(P)H-quinone oxidoreductase [Myceligenerans indicum]MBL0886042.1 NAD(P)H-quinone oxidoreductase [Myceligenerans indicum]